MSYIYCYLNILFLVLFLGIIFVFAETANYPEATVSNYEIFTKIHGDKEFIEVSGDWHLPPLTHDTNEIVFYLSPKMKNLKIEILEPKLYDRFSLKSEAEGGDTKWTLTTKEPLVKLQKVLIRFEYISDGIAAPQFNINQENSFAGSGGELWYPQTSYSNREIGRLHFQVSAGKTVVSNGKLESSEKERLQGSFVFRVDSPSKFGFASGKYTTLRRKGKVNFTLHLLRPRANAQSILEGCSRSLDFLTTLFGKFPYQEFSLVEVDFRSTVLGTSENGFILADSSQFEKDFNLAYWSHELGHQWWGNLIKGKSKTAGQMMLTEGIAQFGALKAIEYLEGKEAAAKFRGTGSSYNKNQSAAGYFELVLAGKDFPLTTYLPQNPNEVLLMHKLANSKGFIVLDMLSRQIGDERFAAILRNFVSQKANQTVSWQELQEKINSNSRQNLDWFFEQWLARVGAPKFQLIWKQKGQRIYGTIKQFPPFYRANIEILLKNKRRKVLKQIEVTDTKAKFSWRTNFKVDEVVLDPNFKVLHMTNPI